MKIIDCQTRTYAPDRYNRYELWIGARWAIPTHIYFIIYQYVLNIPFAQCTIEADGDIIQIYDIVSVYRCIQDLLLERVPFRAIFYKGKATGETHHCGQLTWKQ